VDDHRAIPEVVFADGSHVPALGLGTWRMGEHARETAREIEALRRGMSLGMTLIDTAEMYGEGGAEVVIAKAIAGQRDRVFVVSKVYPHNATAKGVIAACRRSLERLHTDRIDLYLLHWRGRVPLAETVEGFERLRAEGNILRWGVSNFDVDDMRELLALPQGGNCAANQILYNLGERGAEWRLLEQCRSRGILVMAYSPLGQGALLRNRKLRGIAVKARTTPARLALAWTMSQPNLIAIPKASTLEHVNDNRAAVNVQIDPDTRIALDAAFPPPDREKPLSML
jgi:diketogulonate reductase-like aldo/keto reductase